MKKVKAVEQGENCLSGLGRWRGWGRRGWGLTAGKATGRSPLRGGGSAPPRRPIQNFKRAFCEPGITLTLALSHQGRWDWTSAHTSRASARAAPEPPARFMQRSLYGRPAMSLERRLASMSSTMVGRSYSGFQSHSLRAGESSMESGHESAMAWRKGSIS